MILNFVTSNLQKFNETKNILTPFGIELKHVNIDLPEIQGTSEEVIKEKLAFARRGAIQPSFIVEDVSLFFNELNGLPGVGL